MIGNDWDEHLKTEYDKTYFKELLEFVDGEYHTKEIYPRKNEIFNAFRNTSYKDTKVVLLGQDPYHGVNQAQGLSFSVRDGLKKPPSLVNIFKELESDLGIPFPEKNSLLPWANEGVLLLNSVLTVEKDKAASHSYRGWEEFTDKVIEEVNKKDEPVVFIFWGNYARAKKILVTNPKHLVLESAHPSPFSAYNGFFGSRPFSKTNEFLKENNLKPINWNIER